MTEFVKVCPKCKHGNPEYLNVCEKCQQFIGMEVPVAKNTIPEVVKNKASEEQQKAPAPPQQSIADDTTNSSPLEKTSQPFMYLELADNGQLLTIKSGDVLGQDHPTGIAEVKIPKHIQGVEFVHRQHCQFYFEEDKWYLQALDQTRFQHEFTNPTLLNRTALKTEARQQLSHGDVLHLSSLKFNVRLVS